MKSHHVQLVWNILKGMPIEVFDDEEKQIWENDTYELVTSRDEGDFKGSRAIGSANLVTALNIINQKIVIENLANKDIRHSAEIAQKLFGQIIEQLQKEKLIRKIPTKVRQTFKVIEGNNGSST
mgnify:FL=1